MRMLRLLAIGGLVLGVAQAQAQTAAPDTAVAPGGGKQDLPTKDADGKGSQNAAERLQNAAERFRNGLERHESHQVVRIERPLRVERPEKVVRPERVERPEKPEKAHRPGR